MSGKRSRSFKCAVHHRDREVCSENDFHIFLEPSPIFRRMVTVIAMEVLPEERDRKYYADNYSCCPPPLFIILITLVEVSFPRHPFRSLRAAHVPDILYIHSDVLVCVCDRARRIINTEKSQQTQTRYKRINSLSAGPSG